MHDCCRPQFCHPVRKPLADQRLRIAEPAGNNLSDPVVSHSLAARAEPALHQTSPRLSSARGRAILRTPWLPTVIGMTGYCARSLRDGTYTHSVQVLCERGDGIRRPKSALHAHGTRVASGGWRGRCDLRMDTMWLLPARIVLTTAVLSVPIGNYRFSLVVMFGNMLHHWRHAAMIYA